MHLQHTFATGVYIHILCIKFSVLHIHVRVHVHVYTYVYEAHPLTMSHPLSEISGGGDMPGSLCPAMA